MWKKIIPTLIGTIVGVLAGGLITWAVSNHYYKKGGDLLLKETGRLDKLTTMMLTGMEKMHWVDLEIDKKGEIVGFKPLIGTVSIGVEKARFSAEGFVSHPGDLKGKPEKPKK